MANTVNVMKSTVSSFIYRVINSKALLWILLALPAWPYVYDFIKPDLYYGEMMYETGLFATQLFVVTLCITPVSKFLKRFKKTRGLNRWLISKRRNFGVASFAYAMIHTIIYIREIADLDLLLFEITLIEIAFGWIAILLMLPIAFTSNDVSMRKLGKHWKTVQRSVYLLAIATFVHWLSFGFFLEWGILLLQILIVAKLVQLAFYVLNNRAAISFLSNQKM